MKILYSFSGHLVSHRKPHLPPTPNNHTAAIKNHGALMTSVFSWFLHSVIDEQHDHKEITVILVTLNSQNEQC